MKIFPISSETVILRFRAGVNSLTASQHREVLEVVIVLKRVSSRVPPLKVAVVGSGISGLSAAWLLNGAHDVTVYEADGRIGGHSNTVAVPGVAGGVDTGFIVFNEPTYPNFTALLAHLGVASRATDMSFAVSLDGGRLEYGSNGLFAQKRNLLRPRFYAMLRDLVRFYREAPRDLAEMDGETLAAYLDRNRYGTAFRDDHLYPMAAAIWSTPAGAIGQYPAASFVRFCDNHGLLKLINRPIWRTVQGGSRAYVDRLTAPFADKIRRGRPVIAIERHEAGVTVIDGGGRAEAFDHVILACHADQALALLDRPTTAERDVLGAFGYSVNRTVLHSDPALMPTRRRAWSSWNYLADTGARDRLSVSYWMNALQGLKTPEPMIVTLNPLREPDPAKVWYETSYTHPLFDAAASAAQRRLWSLQGVGHVWYAGAHFGAGFHEDGLQAGLAVAELIGGVARPWTVADPSGRIGLPADLTAGRVLEQAA